MTTGMGGKIRLSCGCAALLIVAPSMTSVAHDRFDDERNPQSLPAPAAVAYFRDRVAIDQASAEGCLCRRVFGLTLTLHGRTSFRRHPVREGESPFAGIVRSAPSLSWTPWTGQSSFRLA